MRDRAAFTRLPSGKLQCDLCGEILSPQTSVRKHQTRKPCKAEANKKRMAREGFIEVPSDGGSFIERACTHAAIPFHRSLLVSYRKGAYGRSAHEGKKTYALAWVVRLLESPQDLYSTAGNSAMSFNQGRRIVRAPNGEEIGFEQGALLIGYVLERAVSDIAYRKVLDASVALGGTKALIPLTVEEAKRRLGKISVEFVRAG